MTTRMMTAVKVSRPLPTLTVLSFAIEGEPYHVTHRPGSHRVKWAHDGDEKRTYTVECRPGTLVPVRCPCPARVTCKHMKATVALAARGYLTSGEMRHDEPRETTSLRVRP